MKLDQRRLQELCPQMDEAFARRMEQLIHRLPVQKEDTQVKKTLFPLCWLLYCWLCFVWQQPAQSFDMGLTGTTAHGLPPIRNTNPKSMRRLWSICNPTFRRRPPGTN